MLFKFMQMASLLGLSMGALAIAEEASEPIAAVNPNQNQTAEEQMLTSGRLAADNWLKLIDQGHYKASWQSGAMTMQFIMPMQDWIKMLESSRKPLGAVFERRITDVRIAENPQGIPRGNYLVFVYATTFSNKKQATEVLTLQQGNDGVWRTLTYLISAK